MQLLSDHKKWSTRHFTNQVLCYFAVSAHQVEWREILEQNKPIPFHVVNVSQNCTLRCFIFLLTCCFQMSPPLRSFVPFHSSCGVCCRLGTFPKFGHCTTAAVKKPQVWCMLFNFHDFRAISNIAAIRREIPNGWDQCHRKATCQWRKGDISSLEKISCLADTWPVVSVTPTKFIQSYFWRALCLSPFAQFPGGASAK